jgi:glycosyltransferase involved in cell wall biosynthesis
LRTRPKKLAVVIAAYNEEENIGPLTSRLVRTLDSVGSAWRLIYVIESQDHTFEIAQRFAVERPEVQSLYSPAPSGLGRAFRRGFAAIPADTDIVATMDADLNHQPEQLPWLIEAALASGADIVGGASGAAERKERRHGKRSQALWSAR